MIAQFLTSWVSDGVAGDPSNVPAFQLDVTRPVGVMYRDVTGQPRTPTTPNAVVIEISGPGVTDAFLDQVAAAGHEELWRE